MNLSFNKLNWIFNFLVLISQVQSLSQEKCDKCFNFRELSVSLIMLTVVSTLFMILCFCRCCPRFKQIMFSSAEELSEQKKARDSLKLGQILKNQQQLRSQQLNRNHLLARKITNNSQEENNFMNDSILQDPFGAGILTSVILNPKNLNLPSKQSEIINIDHEEKIEDQQVLNKLTEIKKENYIKKNKANQMFAAAANAASAASYLMHQQRKNSTQNYNTNKFPTNKIHNCSKVINNNLIHQPSLVNFLRKNYSIKPVQLHHSSSLNSFANGQQVKVFNEKTNIKKNLSKPNSKDKNIATLDQHPITLESIFNNKIYEKNLFFKKCALHHTNQSNLLKERLFNSKSAQNIIDKNSNEWLNKDIFNNIKEQKKSLNKKPCMPQYNKYSSNIYRSMPMLYNNSQDFINEDEFYCYDDQANSIELALDYEKNLDYSFFSSPEYEYNEINKDNYCALHSSNSFLVNNEHLHNIEQNNLSKHRHLIDYREKKILKDFNTNKWCRIDQSNDSE